MERNFTNENFERFLRQNADGLRMRPSDKVWKGINQHLNRKRRNMGFLLTGMLLLSTSLGYYMIEGPDAFTAPKQTASSQAGVPESKKLSIAQPGIIAANSITQKQADNLKSEQSPAFSVTSLIASEQPSLSNDIAIVNKDKEAGNDFTATIVDGYPGSESTQGKAAGTETTKEAKDPLSIESVTNSYQPKIRKGKLGLQFFFTPTVSYRSLSENKAYTRTAGNSFQQRVYNINNAVTHKPDFGFQVGVLAKYPVSKNLKLRGGLQFNINRYDIKTFNSSYEVATIQLQTREEFNAVTSYNNFSGYKSDWLENFYFQVAAPVGLEMKVSGNEKTQLGIAATLQPTYLIGDKAYLISQDYKNYMEVPWLVRRWNVNTSFETFVAYSTGKMKWQVGPQVRYQMLSSYEKKYPVKEHLFDFGLKVGVSLKQ
jgi:hypothetical protein